MGPPPPAGPVVRKIEGLSCRKYKQAAGEVEDGGLFRTFLFTSNPRAARVLGVSGRPRIGTGLKPRCEP